VSRDLRGRPSNERQILDFSDPFAQNPEGTLFLRRQNARRIRRLRSDTAGCIRFHKEDPTLNARLDRTPFATRGEAERCREVLRAAEENEQGPEQ
jgi:hypothetical protein